MNDAIRAYVACVAGRIISGEEVDDLYDCAGFKQIPVFSNGSAQGVKIDICENDEKQFLLFQPDTESPIDLTIVENNFKGFDHNSKCFFGGSVRGDFISVFDYESSSYFNYNMKKS